MDEEYCFETGHVCATHHSFPVPALNMAYVLSLIATSMLEIAGRLLDISGRSLDVAGRSLPIAYE